MKKEASRGGSFYIDRGDEHAPDWYNDFVSNLEKVSTQSQRSINDEINSIISNKSSKYSSVEEAVNDMRERTGLGLYLASKIASTQIKSFQEIPEMQIFIDNFIEDRPGTSIESVIHDMLKVDSIREKLGESTDVDEDVKRYINEKIGEINPPNHDNNDMNLGKVDNSSEVIADDPLSVCEPNY